VGLHGLDHTRLTTQAPAAVTGLLRDARRRLEAVVDRPVRLFRPAYGAQSLRTYLAARRTGLRVVVWSADAEDWVDQEACEVADRALSRVTTGGVLLLHDAWHEAGAEATGEEAAGAPGFDRGEVVDRLLGGLQEAGFRAMSVAALTDGRRSHRTAWFRP
jgi:peptidoglycan/xylan/chitin deacetylase (PgdA/CDA1 family)